MAYTPLTQVAPQESTGGADVLPAGAYVCVVTDARLVKSKAGKVNLKLDWDVAEGEHAGHFGAAQYGHSQWLGVEDSAAGYTRHKLDRISLSNSNPPVTFDAAALVDRYVAQYFAGGCIGEMPVTELVGRYVGLVVGTVDEMWQGEVQHRNDVAQWVTVAEVRAGRYTDQMGKIRDIKIPRHRDKTQGGGAHTQIPPQAAPQQAGMADSDIPF